MKTCTKCGETKEFSKFSKSKINKTGFKSWCKECVNNRYIEFKTNQIMQLKKEIKSSIMIENKILLQNGKKICWYCKEICNIEYVLSDGLCRKCKSKVFKEYYTKKKLEKQ